MPTNHQILLDVWNAQKELGKWKTHRSVKPDIKKAIDVVIREGWEVDDIASAIVNLAACYHSKDTRWTYGNWTLANFLTVKHDDGVRKWEQFTDNNYREEDRLTDRAKKDRNRKRRIAQKTTEDTRKPFLEMTPEELDVEYRTANKFNRTLIDKIRDERCKKTYTQPL